MSKTVDEEDEEECFYESLDRLVSSSCSCSTSNSDDDNDNEDHSNSPNYGSDQPFPVPKFPMGVSKYDIWISEPSSVSERRIRLLREMGLSRDPALSRAKPGCFCDRSETSHGDFGRSVSSDYLSHKRRGHSSDGSAGIVRSKSDGAANRNDFSVIGQSPGQCHSSASAPVCAIPSSIPSVHSETPETAGSFVHNHSHVPQSSSNESSVANAVPQYRPPSGRNGTRVEDVQCDYPKTSVDFGRNSVVTVSVNAGRDEAQEGLNLNRIDGVDEQMCKIKNLDNGEEFVVNEIREDGMWNKLKEVGTGRQLTLEEFEITVGRSPIVQELMRRQNVEDGNNDNLDSNAVGSSGGGSKLKKKGSWLKSIKSVASSMAVYRERRSSDERDTSSEKGGRRSSSATDDSQDVSFHGPERVRVRQYGKSHKELSALYKSQEIQAHKGCIWCIKFSLDGKCLASAGEDCVIHVWQVVESEKKGDLLLEKPEDGNFNLLFVANGSPEPNSVSPSKDSHLEKRRRGRSSLSRKSLSFDHVFVPDTIFGLAEKPICSFEGHADDVLDLSWSKSQHLLSSSMDKTVRLWHLSSKSCLKIFSHSDYVTCIQFNPVDDRYFISGSLDHKVRIWSIPDRQVVDWNDLHEMVTAACYTPDGQAALVGSYQGSCHLYNLSDNKLHQKSQINLQNKKKKSHHKKITGFEFLPGSSSEALITSADSRIRVVDGVDLIQKFKGFRNTNSQISASITANGKYVVSASEDSHVYMWKHEGDSRPNRSKSVTATRSYEHFHCQDVSVAIPWPGTADAWALHGSCSAEPTGSETNHLDEVCTANHPPTPVENFSNDGSTSASNSPLHGTISSATNSYFFDRISATWPEEKLILAARNRSPRVSVDFSNGLNQNMSAWGMVIVTAGLRGEIRTFQNFGLPFRI